MPLNATCTGTCFFLREFWRYFYSWCATSGWWTVPSNFSGTIIIVVAIFAISFSVISVFKMLHSGLSVSCSIGCLAACIKVYKATQFYFTCFSFLHLNVGRMDYISFLFSCSFNEVFCSWHPRSLGVALGLLWLKLQRKSKWITDNCSPQDSHFANRIRFINLSNLMIKQRIKYHQSNTKTMLEKNTQHY